LWTKGDFDRWRKCTPLKECGRDSLVNKMKTASPVRVRALRVSAYCKQRSNHC
jgi:hypothetical protein